MSAVDKHGHALGRLHLQVTFNRRVNLVYNVLKTGATGLFQAQAHAASLATGKLRTQMLGCGFGHRDGRGNLVRRLTIRLHTHMKTRLLTRFARRSLGAGPYIKNLLDFSSAWNSRSISSGVL